MTKSIVLVGADPECFVTDGSTIRHCINILGGSKNNPLPVIDGAVQEDNVLFEFNVDPTDDAATFAARIKDVMEQGTMLLQPHGLFLQGDLSSYIYDNMDGFPEKAFEFGCTPDYNAYTGQENPRPSATNSNLRTAGGHVHIGYSHITTVTDDLSRAVINLCDYLLGLPSLFEDKDTRRRELYGKGGACRLKPYGPEYRTLSNYWIWSDALCQTIHERAQKAFALVDRIDTIQALVPQALVQEAINTNDLVSAKAYLEAIRHATK